MSFILLILLPTLICVLPVLVFTLISLRFKSKIGRNIFISSSIALVASIIIPWFAVFVSVSGHSYGLPEDHEPVCATGAASFLFLGYLLNFIGIPIIGIILYLKKRKSNTT
ncbi:MAG: hypothetical protein J5I47_02645 [Vicingus serpentipes]|nr:hypothetical protein [Vicingus serpentipes]